MPGINYQYELIKLYLAAFIRPPEISGLEYWLYQINSGKSFDNVLETIFSLDIVKEIYPEGLPNQAFVTLIYVNVFGKSPDLEGLLYWTQQLDLGRSKGGLVMDMITAGLNTVDGTIGKAYLVNRLSVAQFAVDQQYLQHAELTPSYLKSVMASVTQDAASVVLADKALTSGVTGIGIGPPLNSLVIPAAADGLSAAEVKAGIAVTIDLKGTNATANSTIELLLDRSSFSTPIKRVLTDADVKAQKVVITIPGTENWGADGNKTLSAFVKDASGNVGLPGGDLVVNLNLLPPNTPSHPVIIPAALNGISAVEKAAGVVVTVDLTGVGAGTGDKVELLINGATFSPAASIVLSDANVKTNSVNITISGGANWGADGQKIITARVVDVSGNVGGSGASLAVNLDTTAPGALANALVIPAAVDGINPIEKAANISVIADLTGTNAQAGDSIELLIDGKPFANSTIHVITDAEITGKSATLTIAGGDAAWGTVDGDHIITARMLDLAGNTGGVGGKVTVSVDSSAPNSQNAFISVAAAVNGLSAAEITAGVSVAVTLASTGVSVGDTINLLLGGAAFPVAVTHSITQAELTAKSATVVIPVSANWGLDGNKLLSATITDKAGNTGSPGNILSVFVDTTAPGVPANPVVIPAATNSINSIEKAAGVSVTMDLSGTGAVIGDKVELLLNGTSFTTPVLQTLLNTDIVNGFANIIVPGGSGWGVDGSKTISARVIDVAGNIGVANAGITVNLDTIASSGPISALVVPANSAGGITTLERIAGVDVVVNLNGTSVVAGDQVEILVGGAAFATPVVHTISSLEITAGSATVTIGTNSGWGSDGNKILTARFSDPAGNLGTASGATTVNLDGTAPNSPGTALIVAAAASGISNAERSAGVTVIVDLTGTGALAGDTISIDIDGVAFSTPVTQVITAGQITAHTASVTIPGSANWGADGNKILTANITDSLGNVGAFGGALTVFLDTTPPTPASNPVAIPAAVNSVNLVEENAGVSVLVDLTGSTAVAGDRVEILIGGLPFGAPVIQAIGANDIANSLINVVVPRTAGWGADGAKAISVRFIDVAGNTSASNPAFSMTLDTTPPNPPGNPLSVPANGGGGVTAAEKAAGVGVDVNLAGTNAAAGDTVEILLGGLAFSTPVTHVLTAPEVAAQSATVTIAGNSGWGLDGNKTLTARLTDVSGNVGGAGGSTTISLLDSTPPNTPIFPLGVAVATNGINAAEKLAGVDVVGTLSGTLALAGDTATLFIDAGGFAIPVTHLLTAPEITAGIFSFIVPSNAGWGADGSHILSMTITDAAGNTSLPGGNLTVILDTTAPTAPTNAIVVAAAGNGINLAEKSAGVATTVDLTGSNAVAGDKIEILLSSASFPIPVYHVLSGAEISAGSANVTIDTNAGWGADGVKNLSARVVDIAGNLGAIGGTLTTQLDTTLPAAQGVPVYFDADSSGTINAGDTFIFAISEATTKSVVIGNVSVNNSHSLGTGATAVWDSAGTHLTVTLGASPTLSVSDIVSLVGVTDLAGNVQILSFSI